MPRKTDIRDRILAFIVSYQEEHGYTKSCMFNRNRYLVNNADMLLAAFDGQSGGTEITIRYARQKGIQVCFIRPVMSL